MNKKFTGRIELYTLSNGYVTSKSYSSKKIRNEIIEMWKRSYPHQSFYVIIKPNLEKCQIN
jgi:hypothetical protein